MNICIKCGIELTDENWLNCSQKIHHHICRQCRNNYKKALKNGYRVPKRVINLILCKCGCGTLIEDWDPSGWRYRKFVSGHNMKNIPNDQNHPNWKGGKKIARAKEDAKRKQFGFIPLNDCEVDGWVGHHLDLNYVIFIPEELHKSTYHSVTKNINMNIINDKVYEWFIKYYLRDDF